MSRVKVLPLTIVMLLSFCGAVARAGSFIDAYVQGSIFHHAGYGAVTSGYGRFGYGFTGVPSQFSWSNTFVQPGGPEVTHVFGGWDIVLQPAIFGYNVKNGTGVWQWNGPGFAQATASLVVDGTFHWRPSQPGESDTGVAWIHYILQGRVGTHPGDRCEFVADVQFNFEGRHIPLHLHYLNTTPGATFSGVDLYAEAPFTEYTINGNGTAEIDTNENTTFFVTDPGEGTISGVGSSGAISSNGGPPPTPPPVFHNPGRALNISTRMKVLDGDNALIGGFIINGNASKRVIIRGIGPSLQNFGIPGVLADPTLEIHDRNGVIGNNANWRDTQQTEIQNSGFAPGNDLESAIIMTLTPGAYTAILRGQDHGTGVGLVEVYDLDPDGDSQLANISTRGLVQTGGNVLIGGTILGGSGNRDPVRIVLRAIGPSLRQFGISNPLPDPTLELHDGNGTLIETNDNWRETQQAEIEAAGLAPQNDLESVIISSLPPGGYTAIVADKNGNTGVGSVEAFNLQ